MNTSAQPTKNNGSDLHRPNTKPKRPLSAFNLFYRFKRQKIVDTLAQAQAEGADIEKSKIYGLITAPPGLENFLDSAANLGSPEAVHALQRKNILKDLEGNLEPRDTAARSHRKNRNALNGALSFVELGKIMNSSWKECDPYAKSVFTELAEAGRERYRKVKEAFNAQNRQATAASTINKNSNPQKMPAKKFSVADAEEACPSSHRPSSTGASHGSQNVRTMSETAVAMVQLASGSPSMSGENSNELFSESGGNISASSGPNHRHFSLSSTTGQTELMPLEAARAAPRVTPQGLPSSDPNQSLKLRVKELEEQLEKERLQARIRELEAERSRRMMSRDGLMSGEGLMSREGLMRSALNSAMAQERAAAAMPSLLSGPSFLPDAGLRNLWLQHRMQQASERAMLSRILDPSLPAAGMASSTRSSPALTGSNVRDSLDFVGRPVKKQRLDPSIPASDV